MGKDLPFEKSIDHRGEGYSAADALFDHNAKASITKRKSIVTKPGLKVYSDREAAEHSGEMVVYNYNAAIPWDVFKQMSILNRRDYINHLISKYDDLAVSDLAKMFAISPGVLATYLRDTGIVFPKGGKRFKSAGRIRFEEEMLPKPEEIKQVAEEQRPAVNIKNITFECMPADINAIMMGLNMTGPVQVTITAIERGGKDDGLN